MCGFGAAAVFISSCSAPIPQSSHAPSVSPPAASDSPVYKLEKVQSQPTGGLRSGTSEASVDASVSKPKVHRLGLGTGYGKEVKSGISYTSFKRASEKPYGVSSIYYNDQQGVKAMAGAYGYKSESMQTAAGGLIEWGVKGTWGSYQNYNNKSRRFIVGKSGQRYDLIVKNRSHTRIEVVLSVDGLSVMDGDAASYKDRGYIIGAGETLKVKGFRTSEAAVAAFKFSSVGKSYTNQLHGKTRNVGVIGIAVFTEKGSKPWRWSRPPEAKRLNAKPFAEVGR